MSPTRFSIDRPVAISMAYLSLALLGVVALFSLPVDLMPNTSSSVVSVIVEVRGGLPPEDVEFLVTKPIEEAMATLANLEEIQSVSKKERATVTLSFKPGSNINDATLDVNERLSKIKSKFPRETEKPIVAHYQENDEPIIIMSLTSPHRTPEAMRDLVENTFKPQLTRVSGVANVEIGGGRERKILIEFDKAKLEENKISILEAINTLGSNNVNLLSGKIDRGRATYLVRTMGAFETLDEMRDLGLAVTREGSRIRLKDIANVRDYYMEPESYAHFNGQPTVSIYVQKETQANTVRVVKNIEKLTNEFRRRLPQDIQLTITKNQSVFIKSQIDIVRNAIFHGAFLTALVIWIFLKDWKHTLAVFVAIPTSILITLAAIYVKSALSKEIVTLNVRALQGLALGIGRMVDDSIVVLCNIMDKKNLAAKNHEAVDVKALCVGATRQMSLAIASSTLTTVVVFAPLDFVSEEVRMEYSDLAFTVFWALLSSLCVAITLVPLVCSRIPVGETSANPLPTAMQLAFRKRWMQVSERMRAGAINLKSSFPRKRESSLGSRLRGSDGYAKTRNFLIGYFNGIILEWQGYWVWTRAQLGPGGVFGTYRRLVGWCVRRRGRILGSVFLCFLLSLGIYHYKLEKEFTGNTEQDEFVVFVELPAGAKIDISNQVVTELEKLINALPEVQKSVKNVASKVEGWSSKIYVTLTPESQRARSVQDVIDELRPKVGKLGAQYDAFIYFSEPESSKEVTVDVYGPEPTKLRDLAVNIAGRVERAPGLTDVKLRYKPGRPEVRLVVDKMRAASFGFSVRDIADNLHAMMRGLRATYFNTGGQQVETVARLSEEDRRTLDDVHKLTFVSRSGELVPLDQLVKFDLTLAPSEVYRKDKERFIEVSANRGRVALSTAVKRVGECLQGFEVPIGYHYEFGGDYKKLQKSERQFLLAFTAALGLVYTILACFFESYTQPLIILLTVPLAAVGTMPTLWITHTAVNMGVYIGLLMLGGIVVSNAIILIDRLNERRRRHSEAKKFSLLRSVLEVGQERFEPIMMTSICTILGLAPMAFQRGEASELWRPLAITVISGLAFSTLLTLLVVPCCYVVLTDIQVFAAKVGAGEIHLAGMFSDFWKGRRKAGPRPPPPQPRSIPAFLRNRS
jgi:HAE1 family hydrophobic/amphiphilic exporter-1